MGIEKDFLEIMCQLPVLKTASNRIIPAHKKRRALWELEIKYHCPVIGTCVPVVELRKLLKPFTAVTDDYALHGEAVAACHCKNPLSKALYQYLEKKYVAHIHRFAAATTDEAVLVLWQQHWERGDIAGAMWAALTHFTSSPETGHQVYAAVHMLSHQVGAGLATDARRLAQLQDEIATLRQQYQQDCHYHKTLLTARYARIEELETALGNQQNQHRAALQELAAVKIELGHIQSGQRLAALQQRLYNLEAERLSWQTRVAQVEQYQEQVNLLNKHNQQLQQTITALTREQAMMVRLLERNPVEANHCEACEEALPLKGRCILCVGGRTALLPQYRELAERLGIRFIHHDGGQEQAVSRLPDLLAASDAVICPTDCVSHKAYYQLKRHCKLQKKPCVLTRHSGISGFIAALSRLAAGQADIQPA